AGGCTGVCDAGTHECFSNAMQTCDGSGHWVVDMACPGGFGCAVDGTQCANCDPQNYSDPCNKSECNANHVIVDDGPGCLPVATFCCCVDETNGTESCMRRTACHADDGSVFCG